MAALSPEVHDEQRLAAVRRTGLLDSGPEDVFRRFGRLATRLTGAPISLISLITDEGIHLKCDVGLPRSVPTDRPLPFTRTVCHLVVDRPDALIIADVDDEPRLDGISSAAIGMRSYLGIPLIDREGQVLGSFSVADGAPRAWTTDDVEAMQDLGRAVVAKIELRTLRRSGQGLIGVLDEPGAAGRTENLLQLAQALTAAEDVATVADLVAANGRRVAGAAFSNIAVATGDGDHLELRHGGELDPGIQARWPTVPLDDSTPVGRAVSSGRPVLLAGRADIRSRFPVGADDADRAGFQALAAFPTPQARAAVGFAWCEPIEFTPTLRRTLDFVAQLTGMALARAAAGERDRQIADRLQRSLLPAHLPRIDGVQITGRYHAGTADLHVGGDWYDVTRLDADRWILAVGDLVGHGLQAAAAMGQLRNAFTALATGAPDVRTLVERVDIAAADIPGAPLSTLVAAELDRCTNRLRLVSAGHPPPLLLRAGGRVERVEGGGPPIALEPDIERVPIDVTLDAGDTALFYTDGLVERRGESIEVGLRRLEQTLLGALASGAVQVDDLCDWVTERLATGTEDDVAILALRIDTPPRRPPVPGPGGDGGA